MKAMEGKRKRHSRRGERARNGSRLLIGTSQSLHGCSLVFLGVSCPARSLAPRVSHPPFYPPPIFIFIYFFLFIFYFFNPVSWSSSIVSCLSPLVPIRVVVGRKLHLALWSTGTPSEQGAAQEPSPKGGSAKTASARHSVLVGANEKILMEYHSARKLETDWRELARGPRHEVHAERDTGLQAR